MTKEEFISQKKILEQQHKRNIFRLEKDYAESNNPVKTGDIITDHYHTIQVNSWNLSHDHANSMPCLKYYGVQVKKDGTPFKRGGTNNDMWQCNIKYINDKPYTYAN